MLVLLLLLKQPMGLRGNHPQALAQQEEHKERAVLEQMLILVYVQEEILLLLIQQKNLQEQLQQLMWRLLQQVNYGNL